MSTTAIPFFPRVNGHRGYAERSRKERTWDPGSTFFAEDANKNHGSGPQSYNRRMDGGKGIDVNGAPPRGKATKRQHQRDRRRASAKVHEMEMDWGKVTSSVRIAKFDPIVVTVLYLVVCPHSSAAEVVPPFASKAFQVATPTASNVGNSHRHVLQEYWTLLYMKSLLDPTTNRVSPRFNIIFDPPFNSAAALRWISSVLMTRSRKSRRLWARDCSQLPRSQDSLMNVFGKPKSWLRLPVVC